MNHPILRWLLGPGWAAPLLLATAHAASPQASFANAKVKVMLWPYDFTTPTTAQLSALGTEKEQTELRRATDRVVTDFLCGQYTGEFDFMGGYALDVFPDGTAMLEQTSDMGTPLLVGEGTWTARPDGASISWKSLHLGHFKDFFLQTHGDCRELGLYLSFAEHRVREVILISHEFEPATEIKNYFVRRKEFVDWQAIRDELGQSGGPKKTQPSRPRQ